MIVELHNPHGFTTVPKKEDFQQWIQEVLSKDPIYEYGIRLVNEEESAQLNEQFLQKSYATNVLAFPCEGEVHSLNTPYLGDLALCHTIIEKEAHTQKKDLMAHWAHLVIHGTLHLLGYDHETEEEAKVMEQLEINHLKQLGYENPY